MNSTDLGTRMLGKGQQQVSEILETRAPKCFKSAVKRIRALIDSQIFFHFQEILSLVIVF